MKFRRTKLSKALSKLSAYQISVLLRFLSLQGAAEILTDADILGVEKEVEPITFMDRVFFQPASQSAGKAVAAILYLAKSNEVSVPKIMASLRNRYWRVQYKFGQRQLRCSAAHAS